MVHSSKPRSQVYCTSILFLNTRTNPKNAFLLNIYLPIDNSALGWKLLVDKILNGKFKQKWKVSFRLWAVKYCNSVLANMANFWSTYLFAAWKRMGLSMNGEQVYTLESFFFFLFTKRIRTFPFNLFATFCFLSILMRLIYVLI